MTKQRTEARARFETLCAQKLSRELRHEEWAFFMGIGRFIDYLVNKHPAVHLWVIFAVWSGLHVYAGLEVMAQEYRLYCFYGVLAFTGYRVVRWLFEGYQERRYVKARLAVLAENMELEAKRNNKTEQEFTARLNKMSAEEKRELFARIDPEREPA